MYPVVCFHQGKEQLPKIANRSEHDSGFTNSLRDRPELVSMRHPNTLTRLVMQHLFHCCDVIEQSLKQQLAFYTTVNNVIVVVANFAHLFQIAAQKSVALNVFILNINSQWLARSSDDFTCLNHIKNSTSAFSNVQMKL